jgi:hypothetical protein
MYAFTENPVWKDRLLAETRSGSLIFNDVLMQLACAYAFHLCSRCPVLMPQTANELPMSGIGESGCQSRGLV